ncbi:hypothetical protein TNCV_262241 [Trichonephila clavipes]|nr:hypothetical protein TNCV_262241 [Trichonephila clavipes]
MAPKSHVSKNDAMDENEEKSVLAGDQKPKLLFKNPKERGFRNSFDGRPRSFNCIGALVCAPVSGSLKVRLWLTVRCLYPSSDRHS